MIWTNMNPWDQVPRRGKYPLMTGLLDTPKLQSGVHEEYAPPDDRTP
jgi:hypothetical protein